jgi:hypothetical protein
MVVRVNIQLDMLHFRLPVSSRVSATMLVTKATHCFEMDQTLVTGALEQADAWTLETTAIQVVTILFFTTNGRCCAFALRR